VKARIFYDGKGAIQSVMEISRRAKSTPTSDEFACVKVDLKALKARTLAELHFDYRVNARGKVVRRPRSKRRKHGDKPGDRARIC
jgi:hypothetical protein